MMSRNFSRTYLNATLTTPDGRYMIGAQPERNDFEGGTEQTMMRQERAKIFAPFDAMKGLQEALRAQEENLMRTPRREICEEDIARNSAVLQTLKRGMEVELFYRKDCHDILSRGKITFISGTFGGYLELDHEPVGFADIYEITVL